MMMKYQHKKRTKKSIQCYKDTYQELWLCFEQSKKGSGFGFVCNSDFSCIHGGKNDCKRHVERKQHKDYITI